MVVQDLVGQDFPVVQPAGDVNDRENEHQGHEDHEVEALVGDGVDAAEDRSGSASTSRARKYEPIQRMKNRPKRIARITATSENRGKSRAMTSRLNANMPRKSIASRFCGVLNRSTLSKSVAG